MACAFFYDVPGDERIYAQVKAELGDELPEGLLVQVVTKRPEGGLRHFNVWESKEAFDRFQRERVGPAVAKVLRGLGITEAPAPPTVEDLELVDVISRPITSATVSAS
jgi:hypothetical protein